VTSDAADWLLVAAILATILTGAGALTWLLYALLELLLNTYARWRNRT
jgi:hypothetical protein